jgi:DNA repair photolyase
MNDPYQPVERTVRLTGRALEIIAEFGFPVHILTKSDLVLRDVETLLAINARAGPAGAVASFTITTADDDLARKVEPGAPLSSARFAALAALAEHGIRTGIMLMPVLPFIEDSVANITTIVTRAVECGASYVVLGLGMTLRDRQRAYYYTQLDRLFPGLRATYERRFGERYHASAQAEPRLEAAFGELAARYGLARGVAPYQPSEPKQLSLF